MTQDNKYDWKRHPKAEQLLIGYLSECVNSNAVAKKLEQDLLHLTSTRLLDWVDHFVVGPSSEAIPALEAVGFVADPSDSKAFHHPGALLPRVVINEDTVGVGGVAVVVESIADFLMVRGLNRPIEGASQSGFRICAVETEDSVTLWAVERRGTWTMKPTTAGLGYLDSVITAKERWQTRPRSGDENHDMNYALTLAKEIGEAIGVDRAAWVVLEVEREYWQARNTAAQVQKGRQDHLGMGWANHDHHTFRSTRRHFRQLVNLFEELGFHCRERFYAGEEAGWGAQVMENSNCNMVLFLDVDLDPEEIEIDFAHTTLEERDHRGTIGLWCELHGDSILRAGMHHLEAQFMFDELKTDLDKLGVGMMDPFSDFEYLRQAFTAGEIWHVLPERIEKLVAAKLIDETEAGKFREYGAVGSHLENLQRRDGYKGFNQKNVSFIIKKTDPRSLDV